ncbi:hypothetical protein [Deinococcus fonticola]|uniref:hypothetical protein n=1 Tax=Deinococcus fonticola TaxID=2528713 RepID=UPI0010755A6B|nr:hypothetical protein [Deinococcus fonticola]
MADMIVNGRTWAFKPVMKLIGGSNGKQVRRLWAGGFVAVDTTSVDPLVIECSADEKVVVDATDARQIWDLWKAGTEFPATFPGVLADGTALIVTRAIVLEAPSFKFILGRGGTYRVASYSFRITVLDDI